MNISYQTALLNVLENYEERIIKILNLDGGGEGLRLYYEFV